MNEPNPYAPPQAPGGDIGESTVRTGRWKSQRIVFSMLVGLQFLGALWYSGSYLHLVRIGVVSAIALLGLLVGSLLLYGTTLVVITGRARGMISFGLATILLLLSLRGWGLAYVWGWVVAFAAVLAMVGVILVRAMKTKESG